MRRDRHEWYVRIFITFLNLLNDLIYDIIIIFTGVVFLRLFVLTYNIHRFGSSITLLNESIVLMVMWFLLVVPLFYVSVRLARFLERKRMFMLKTLDRRSISNTPVTSYPNNDNFPNYQNNDAKIMKLEMYLWMILVLVFGLLFWYYYRFDPYGFYNSCKIIVHLFHKFFIGVLWIPVYNFDEYTVFLCYGALTFFLLAKLFEFIIFILLKILYSNDYKKRWSALHSLSLILIIWVLISLYYCSYLESTDYILYSYYNYLIKAYNIFNIPFFMNLNLKISYIINFYHYYTLFIFFLLSDFIVCILLKMMSILTELYNRRRMSNTLVTSYPNNSDNKDNNDFFF